MWPSSSLPSILKRTVTTSSLKRSLAVTSLLTKSPDDVVITYAARTAMTRGKKGGLKDTSSDSLLYNMLKTVQVRSGVDPALVEDITTGMLPLRNASVCGTIYNPSHHSHRRLSLPIPCIRGPRSSARSRVPRTSPSTGYKPPLLIRAHGRALRLRLHCPR